MSYLSQSPDVYQYARNGVGSSIDQRIASYQQNQIANSFNPPTFNNNDRIPPQYNQFGQSQIQSVYQPLSFQNNQPQPQVNRNQVYVNSNQPRSIVLSYPSPPTNASIPTTKVNQPLLVTPEELRGSLNGPNGGNSGARFDNYLHSQRGEYKYNLFSVIDEPWNNRKCSHLSGNQCIASGRSSIRK